MVYTDTTYDVLGRKSTVSNPYRSNSDPTYGITTYQYDPLDRVVLEIPPDGTATKNNVGTAYGGQTTGILGLTTTVTDQAGKKHMSVMDALGHLVDVWEPDSTGSLVNETAYSYDPLNDLLQVTQKGNASQTLWRTRTFSYDSLSRLLSASNPESGLLKWTYDNDSNVLTKSDARNVVVTYNYDQLHRVATTGTTHAKSYSNGDVPVDYYFDQTSYNGLTIAEGVNHRTGMSDATGQTAWTFDSVGRTLKEQRSINISGVTSSAITQALNYSYNLDGSLASLIYPSTHTVNYTYNNAGRVTSAIDPNGGTPINYVSWDCPQSGVYCYSPQGAELRLIRGMTSSFAGIISNNAYNSRLQPTQLAATSGSSEVLSLNFNFNLGVNDNGTLARIVDNVYPGLSKTFTYDPLNRIKSAVNDSTSNDASNWGNIYSLDAWGNLYQKNPCDGTICPVKANSDPLTVSITNNKNQFDTYSYDSNGNLLNDQLGNTFIYDAENRPSKAGGVSYYYDGESERVAKSNGTLYWFGTNSAPVAETDLSGNLISEYIFVNGSRAAVRKAGNNSVYFYFADQVGSAQIMTNAPGRVVVKQIEYHPYGEERVVYSSITDAYRFTGKEHDDETNDDYFGARYYGSNFARFLTPDWAATPVPVPYAVMGNPQTLNLYSYVQNNPITGTDPDGHLPGSPSGDSAWQDEQTEFTTTSQAFYREAVDAAGRAQQQPPPPPAQNASTMPLAPPAPIVLPALGEAAKDLVGGLIETLAAPLIILDYLVSPGTTATEDKDTIHGPPPSTSQQGAVDNSPINSSRSTLPRDAAGNYVPHPDAQGAHSTTGTRIGSDGKPYRQGATFDSNGRFTGRTDVSNHGRGDHVNPHFHPATGPASVRPGPGEPVPQD